MWGSSAHAWNYPFSRDTLSSAQLILSGNLWGLHERAVACATLEAFAQRLSAARSAILLLLPQSEHAALDGFYARTVGAAGGRLLFSPWLGSILIVQ